MSGPTYLRFDGSKPVTIEETSESGTRTRSEQITDILRLVEHVWKLHPDWTFIQVATIEQVAGTASLQTDGQYEKALRDHLRIVMGRARDVT